ncbi:MAG: roadblock/LC7 domain-containing protein [Gemmatimonadetes bacterium]|nr:roadblock/LC7 domain-containing protein [Gemmatimonadota bacterium]
MATIRDVVQALGRREGVDAVIVLGRDGLTIDAAAANGLDADGLAALVPSVAAACTRLGNAALRGEFTSGVVEFGRGMVVVTVLTPEVLLAMVVAPGVNIGALLFELHRHRAAIAGLL